MLRFLLVGLGGALGSMARYSIGVATEYWRYPWATLGINLAGSFALGLFLTWALGRWPVTAITPISVGLLGGFTTFSAFSWESFVLVRSGRLTPAIVYMFVSVVGGMLLAGLGYMLARPSGG